MGGVHRTALWGTALTVIYTLMISSADAITKFIASGFAAPQLFCISGGIVTVLSWGASRFRNENNGLRTKCPRAMALRSTLTVVGSVAFFYAFRFLTFAEVFIFIGLMPVFAGILSAPILGEHVRPMAWLALFAGVIGVLCLFPVGIASVSFGHVIALFASFVGTLSMILARFIGKRENNALAQVFYPNLALCLTMTCALPFVFVPMGWTDLGWIVAYAGFLFIARWVLVVALRVLAAYAVTPLMNLQFVWMVILGAVFFAELPSSNIYLGVSIVIGAGVFLIYDQMQPDGAPYPWVLRIRTRFFPAIRPEKQH